MCNCLPLSKVITRGASARRIREDRLVGWLVFAVIASLLPFAISWFGRKLDDDPLSACDVLYAMIGHGELLLASAAIAFPAIGLLFMSRASGTIRGALGGMTLLLVVCAGGFYGAVYTRTLDADDEHFVAVVSVLTFLVLFFASLASVIVARERQRRRQRTTAVPPAVAAQPDAP